MTKKKKREPSIKTKTYLAWCKKHAFVTVTEILYATYIPRASCGCMYFKEIKSLEEVIEIVKKIRHATWYKTIKLGELHINFVGYKDHFYFLKRIKWKIEAIIFNLRHLTEEK